MGIFEEEEKVLENARESAKALGAKPPEVQKKKVKVAKSNCKHCYGKGVLSLSFPGNRGNKRESTVYCRCVKEKEVEVLVKPDS